MFASKEESDRKKFFEGCNFAVQDHEALKLQQMHKEVERGKREAESALPCLECEDGGLYCSYCGGRTESDVGLQFGEGVCTMCGGRAWGDHYKCDCNVHAVLMSLDEDKHVVISEEELRAEIAWWKASAYDTTVHIKGGN